MKFNDFEINNNNAPYNIPTSSPVSTLLMVNGGSSWEKPSNGGREQLVTNCVSKKKIQL